MSPDKRNSFLGDLGVSAVKIVVLLVDLMADLILFNANVLTMDPLYPKAEGSPHQKRKNPLRYNKRCLKKMG